MQTTKRNRDCEEEENHKEKKPVWCRKLVKRAYKNLIEQCDEKSASKKG